jgi:molybdate transport system ATP-binding protein
VSLHASVALRLGTLDLNAALDVAAGEVVAILGPNGAGKTTLLRAIAGLLPLPAGRIELGGQVLEDPQRGIRVPPRQRAVGILFQDHLLFPHLSALDNVAFGLQARGSSRRAARQRAAEWLDRVHLCGAKSAKPRALSGGQAQRVALARALAPNPALLLLDEPLAALDVEARLTVHRELRTHLNAFTGPCLLVTHQPVEAITLADRLVILEAGRIIQQGSIDEVARRPRSTWVARLVGINLYRGHAHHGHIRLGSGRALFTATAVDGEVFAVIHPRAVALHRSQPAGSPRNVWSGTIHELDLHGDHIRVHVAGAVPIVAEVTPAAVADLDLGCGGPIWVSVKASAIQPYPA